MLDLLRADYTFVNERLARHYGIPNVKGTHFRRVTLPADSRRRGLLGHGSILTVTSLPNRTSPVVRGKWILENLLGAAAAAAAGRTCRRSSDDRRLGARRCRCASGSRSIATNPTCASLPCDRWIRSASRSRISTPSARWRTLDELRRTDRRVRRAARRHAVRRASTSSANRCCRRSCSCSTLTEKLLTYALGRGVEHYDMPAVRAIVRDAADDDYRFSSFILGVVESTPFR